MTYTRLGSAGAGGALAVVASVVAGLPACAEETVTFAPHRAVYDITLTRASAGSGVADLDGRMVYELTGSACEGYTQNMRFVTRMSNQEGSPQINDLRTSSWEEAGGRRLRFNTSQYRDDQLAEQSQGDAVRDPATGEIKVQLSKPTKQTLTFKSNVFFPVQHSIALVEAARAGKSIFLADLYDGSEKGEKVYATTTVIGRQMRPGAVKMPAAVKNGDRLDALPFWPMSISYFEPGSDQRDSVPTYELSFRFYQNGVSTNLNIDYGDFAIHGELKELTFLEAARCETERK